MKKLILLLFLLPSPAFAQHSFDFEDGVISSWLQFPPGHWNCESQNALSGKYSFHHSFDSQISGESLAFFSIKGLTPTAGETEWRFKVRYGCDPSSANNWSFILSSDIAPDATGDVTKFSGYVAGVNYAGYDDTLRIWRVNNGAVTPVTRGGINWQEDVGTAATVSVAVKRSAGGNWLLSVGNAETGEPEISEGLSPENWFCGYSGILYRYTSTRDRLLWLDDISVKGTFYEDNEPPSLVSVRPSGYSTIEIELSEQVSPQSLNNSTFILNGNEITGSTEVLNGNTVKLNTGTGLINKAQNRIVLAGICDLSGNCMLQQDYVFPVCFPETGDIIISEIMADPSPVILLPSSEYLELFNRTAFDVLLTGWTIEAGGDYFSIPDISIPREGYLTLCRSADTSSFKKIGNCTGLKSFPSLTDNGKRLILYDSSKTMIHGADYSISWYRSGVKSQGGWSLEIIDTGYPFSGADNWKASVAEEGGTPSAKNSVDGSNHDHFFSGVEKSWPSGSREVKVSFSETVVIEENPGKSKWGGQSITSVAFADSLHTSIMLRFTDEFKRHELYKVSVKDFVRDFAGNVPENGFAEFGLPEEPLPGSIRFNELLFDPEPEGFEFVELYSLAQYPVDLSSVSLAVVSGNDTSELCRLSDDNLLLLPSRYHAVTESEQYVAGKYTRYNPQAVFELQNLPSFPDQEGVLLLMDLHGKTIDRFPYDKSMHFPVLQSFEGVSLEKLRNDLSSESRSSWHSASGAEGWGTPGMPNSVKLEKGGSGSPFIFSSSRISPDSDGFEDAVIISLDTGYVQLVLTAEIYTGDGFFLKKIMNDTTVSGGDTIVWDGTGKDGYPVEKGIYVILITAFDSNGKTIREKRALTVIR